MIDVRPRVDQVHPALEQHDAAHRRAVHVPAVAVAGVHDREVIALQQVIAQRVGAFVHFPRRKTEIDFDFVFAVRNLEDVVLYAPHVHAVADLDALALDIDRLHQFFARPDAAKREGELHPHQFFGLGLGNARREQLFTRREAVIAAEDVGHLCIDLPL